MNVRLLRAQLAAVAVVLMVLPTRDLVTAADPAPITKNGIRTRWAADVTSDRVHPEYPRPQLVRPDWQSLNGNWQFAPAKKDEAPPFGRDLPGTILVPFPVESELSGVGERHDRVWYRRTFEIPAAWQRRRIWLNFGAVDWEAKVFVDGKPVVVHQGGFDPFSSDITEFLTPEAKHELVVGVFDPTSDGSQPHGKQVTKPEGIWYTPSTGIWQTVWLEPRAESSIGRLRMTPDVDQSRLRLVVEPSAVGNKTANDKLLVEAVAFDGSREVAREAAKVSGRLGEPLEIELKNPKLWWPDSPFLYDLKVTLRSGEVTLDQVDSYFGMRKIALGQVDGVTRILLNGKFIFQMGPLDQGFWPEGLYTAPTDEAMRYDLEVTQRLGFNMTRKHVKVEPARWYTYCDRMGLLVWQDMPHAHRAPKEPEHFERELDRMIEHLHNHPSIVMWVVFNEGWGQYDTRRLTAHVKESDPSRLVSNASGWTDKDVGDIIDMHKYPGPGAPKVEVNRAAVLGEFGGLGLVVDGHTWTQQNWSYQGTAGRDHLTYSYVELLRKVWELSHADGLSAAVYTQITDVETETNGLLTYDRSVLKVDAPLVAAANRGRFPSQRVILATAESEPVTWRCTQESPADGWFSPGFADDSWQSGPAGFGTSGTPGAVVRTEWKSPDIWLRREFEGSEKLRTSRLLLRVHHDEDVEVYLNGVLAAKAGGHTVAYGLLPITPESAAAIVDGKNVVAVHCHQTGGGQYIDVGLVELNESPVFGVR